MRNIEKELKREKALQEKLDLILTKLEELKEALGERKESKTAKKSGGIFSK